MFCIPLQTMLYFPFYEHVKKTLRTEEGQTGFGGLKWNEGDLKLYSISAGIAGSIVTVATTPLHVVRTRMQAEIFKSTCDIHFENKYGQGPLSIFPVMKQIY